MKRTLQISALAILLTTLAACGSAGLGDLGGILGSSGPSTSSDVRGTVTYIDTSAQRIDMNVQTVNNLRQSSGSNGAIYYDNSTVVEYQGNRYNVADLERGDGISVVGTNQNGRYVATTITVTSNVRQ